MQTESFVKSPGRYGILPGGGWSWISDIILITKNMNVARKTPALKEYLSDNGIPVRRDSIDR